MRHYTRQRRPRRFWTRAEDETLRKGIEDKRPLSEIGKLIGRNGNSCNVRALTLGLKQQKKKREPAAAPLLRNQYFTSVLPTLPHVPGIIVTGRYTMRPVHVE